MGEAASMMPIEEYKDPCPHRRLYLSGSLDASRLDFLELLLDQATRPPVYPLVLDMAGVSYLSSGALQALQNTAEFLNSLNKMLVIKKPSEALLYLMAQMDLDQSCYFLGLNEDLDEVLLNAPPLTPLKKEQASGDQRWQVAMLLPDEAAYQQIYLSLPEPYRQSVQAQFFNEGENLLEAWQQKPPDHIVVHDQVHGAARWIEDIKINKSHPWLPFYRIKSSPDLDDKNFKLWADEVITEPTDFAHFFALIDWERRRARAAHAKMQQLHLTFKSTEHNCQRAEASILPVVAGTRLHPSFHLPFMTAVREMLNNARLHGNAEDDELEIDVIMSVNIRQLNIQISDQGQGFDYEKQQQMQQNTQKEVVDRAMSAQEGGGLGIVMAQQAVSHLSYHAGGSTVLLAQDLDAQARSQHMGAS